MNTSVRKNSILVVLLAGLLPSLASRAETPGPVQCGGPEGSCYQVFIYDAEPNTEASKGWPSARTAANGKLNDGVSGHLATITSPEEDEFIRLLAIQTFADTGLPSGELWVGGQQLPIDGAFVEPDVNWSWINGEGLFMYQNWEDGEPNNQGGEQYLGIGLGGFGQQDYGWNDERVLGNIRGYVVEFGAWFPQENADVLPPSPLTQMTAVAQEVVEAGTFRQYSCLLSQPVHSYGATNLVREIRNTPGCEELAENLAPGSKAWLHPYQRAFATIVDDNGNVYDNTVAQGSGRHARLEANFVVTLVTTRDLNGQPAALTRGVLLSEEEAATLLPAEPTCNTSPVSDSPTTVGVTLSERTSSGSLARNVTATCNRTRSAVRFSDNLFAYPIRNISAVAHPWIQVLQEGIDLRQTINMALRDRCVDPQFLRELRRQTDAALVNALSGQVARIEAGIAAFQEATVFALDVPGETYGDCPGEPKGEIGSRLLGITFQVHRGLRYPDTYVLYQIPDEIKDLLPSFAGETPPVQ